MSPKLQHNILVSPDSRGEISEFDLKELTHHALSWLARPKSAIICYDELKIESKVNRQ